MVATLFASSAHAGASEVASMGPVVLGMSVAQVIEVMGKPKSARELDGFVTREVTYSGWSCSSKRTISLRVSNRLAYDTVAMAGCVREWISMPLGQQVTLMEPPIAMAISKCMATAAGYLPRPMKARSGV